MINRVARNLEEGKELFRETLMNYFYGVARNVLREYQRSPQKLLSPLESVNFANQPSDSFDGPRVLSDDADAEREMDCLDRCLERLPPETRSMILSYYDWEAGEKIKSRRRLAGTLGITINTLRIRAHRLREEIETCLLRCLERGR